MTQIRIRKAAALLNVSDDTVRRWIDQGRLAYTLDPSGRMVVNGADLAQLAQERAERRRSSHTEEDSDRDFTSARNQFEGLVTRVVSDTVMSSVELQCGLYRVMALISTEAVEQLGLKPGTLAVARVKATNVIVDRLDPQ
jgi:molybdopterin-binding protein